MPDAGCSLLVTCYALQAAFAFLSIAAALASCAISVTINVEEDVAFKVIPLQKQAAPFSAYIKRAANDEAFINSIDPEWSGAIPATFIFRPDGTLAQRLIGQQSFEKFSKALQAAEMTQQVGASR